MTGHVSQLSWIRPEDFGHQVGVLDRHVEQGALAGRTVVSDCSLVHVADVVQLVAVLDMRPALVARAAGGVGGIDGGLEPVPAQ